jgi:hypothetical protein
MFRVKTKGFDQEYDRWTDALDQANSLIPSCKGLFGEIRILEKGELIWTYTRSHKYPMYIGAGVYDRLARRFMLENTLDPAEGSAEESIESPAEEQLDLFNFEIEENPKAE